MQPRTSQQRLAQSANTPEALHQAGVEDAEQHASAPRQDGVTERECLRQHW